ncbi:uncharacterized protein UMAG_12127 [Mycosarcoma maydis]|uniref:Uncharacterized protein n=1 Tax=Mycosarcoma maydis TaxID=5270 RepID=A0A0D1CXX9_MYCMD|nr:uncharacterized protein UMAG_12127 [Ustilago maydis 521]KIS71223.1 hypothetical protein UMAG_12127 [Ustilago maydis 521]|eukprot:XP_011387494.1 hypothetical protein UMAG_12127 [Ustilago maydis 521]
MLLSTPIVALTQLILSALHLNEFKSTPHSASTSSTSARLEWSGDLPPFPDNSGALVSACTFAVGPPGPPASALCPAFNAFCSSFRDDMRARHIRSLKSTAPFPRPFSASANDDDDQGNPLHHVKFRTGCTGGAETASDGSYISAYTATCIVDGVDWVPYVFDQFLRAEFSEKDKQELPIYSSFVGCQVPARL